MVTTSSAAVMTLDIGAATWEKDIVLQLVSKLASPLQLTVNVIVDAGKKGTASPSLSLTFNDVTLTQRNTILRTICGYGLHFALDQAPYYLLGGHAFAATKAQGPCTAAAAMGAIHMWQSMASSSRSSYSSSDDVDASLDLLQSLERHLQDHSFLVAATCQPTVADLDIAHVLLSSTTDDAATSDITSSPNIQRWLTTVSQTMAQYAHQTGITLPYSEPHNLTPPTIIPTFFDGTEDIALLSSAATAVASSSTGNQKASGSDNKSKQQQANQNNNSNVKEKPKKEPKKGKQPKGGQQAAAAAAPAEWDVGALNIRIGKIVKAWHHQEAEKLFCEEIDLGTELGVRQIASGLRPFYQTSDLENRKVLVLCNLKKRNLVGFPSHGMVLCASNADHTKVEFVVPPEDAVLGERVTFAGYDDKEPEAENKIAKKKIFEAVAPHLQTDDQGQVVWKGKPAMTSAGPVKALNGMPKAQVS